MNKQYSVDYQTEIITGATFVKSNGCNCIAFEAIDNVAVQVATIDNSIPLFYGMFRMFNNNPGEIIKKDFQVVFPNSGTVNRLLVVRTYYRELN